MTVCFKGESMIFFSSIFTERNGELKNQTQHISAGHPTLKEIKRALPNSKIYGYKNCDVWLRYMLFSRKPFLGLFCGLLYYLLWRKKDSKPPYWGAVIVWDALEDRLKTSLELSDQSFEELDHFTYE